MFRAVSLKSQSALRRNAVSRFHSSSVSHSIATTRATHTSSCTSVSALVSLNRCFGSYSATRPLLCKNESLGKKKKIEAKESEKEAVVSTPSSSPPPPPAQSVPKAAADTPTPSTTIPSPTGAVKASKPATSAAAASATSQQPPAPPASSQPQAQDVEEIPEELEEFLHACDDSGSNGMHNELRQRIEQQVTEIKAGVLKPLDSTFHFVSDSTYLTPIVMLLGNHSAGKSTLINYILGREVQQTGVAPTDDGFTIIRRGEYDQDDDGPSSVSNPNFQFEDLSQFGFHFVNRFKLKTRELPQGKTRLPYNMMLVDTPGMIDTPIHVQDRTTLSGQLRGYDFLATTRWFAQRSDVILLMFDPANPGTTGETLDVLTKSLSGLEHKFLLIMNKVDVFDKMTDFARAYGTLCWNLSKVINLKDIPRIYTTSTPLEKSATSAGSGSVKGTYHGMPLEEMKRQRGEIITEILQAPLRRLDNLLTETEETAKRVLLAGQVCTAMRREYQQRLIGCVGLIGSTCVVLPLALLLSIQLSVSSVLLTLLVGGFSTVIACLIGKNHLTSYENELVNKCDLFLDVLYPAKKKTLDVQLRWENVVKPEILQFVRQQSTMGISGEPNMNALLKLPRMSQRNAKRLEAVIKSDIPRLRVEVAEYKNTIQKSKPKKSRDGVFGSGGSLFSGALNDATNLFRRGN